MRGKTWVIVLFTSLMLNACSYQKPTEKWASLVKIRISKTDEEWRKQLTPQQYYVLREKGTERAFSGQYWNNHEKGIYLCAACQFPLFSSQTKFESRSGWPSFYQAVSDTVIIVGADMSNEMIRNEVVCSHCGGHLGHVFEDGPKPTGLRYCMNSVALKFVKKN